MGSAWAWSSSMCCLCSLAWSTCLRCNLLSWIKPMTDVCSRSSVSTLPKNQLCLEQGLGSAQRLMILTYHSAGNLADFSLFLDEPNEANDSSFLWIGFWRALSIWGKNWDSSLSRFLLILSFLQGGSFSLVWKFHKSVSPVDSVLVGDCQSTHFLHLCLNQYSRSILGSET